MHVCMQAVCKYASCYIHTQTCIYTYTHTNYSYMHMYIQDTYLFERKNAHAYVLRQLSSMHACQSPFWQYSLQMFINLHNKIWLRLIIYCSILQPFGMTFVSRGMQPPVPERGKPQGGTWMWTSCFCSSGRHSSNSCHYGSLQRARPFSARHWKVCKEVISSIHSGITLNDINELYLHVHVLSPHGIMHDSVMLHVQMRIKFTH